MAPAPRPISPNSHHLLPQPTDAKKRKRDAVAQEAVHWLRDLALNPCDPGLVVPECERAVLETRRRIYVDLDGVEDLQELPNFAALRKKKKARQIKGRRRSERIAKSIKLPKSHLVILRKRIGIGDTFQADVPDWSGPPSGKNRSNYRNNTSNLKYLGTQLWPLRSATAPNNQNQNQNQNVVPRYVTDKSMPDDVECIRRHVNFARIHLKSELGQGFHTLGFGSMGEEVGNIFTHEHQMLFDALERGITPLSGPKGFWGIALRHLKGREMRHLVRYFFNIYLMRKVAYQSRSGMGSGIDSDEDVDGDDDDDDDDDDEVQASSSHVSSDRMQSRKKSL